jgi:hypothetical protein
LRERKSAVGVSVLCPAYVPTRIADSEPPQPAAKSKERLAKEAALKKAVASGKLSADDVIATRIRSAFEDLPDGAAVSIGLARYDPRRPSSILELLMRADAETG